MQTVEMTKQNPSLAEALASLEALSAAPAPTEAAPAAPEPGVDEAALLAQLASIQAPLEAPAAPEAPEPVQTAPKGPAFVEDFDDFSTPPMALDEDVLAGLATAELRAEVYQAQVPETQTALDGAAPPVVATTGSTKKPKAPKAPGSGAPRKERDLNALPAETFVRFTGEDPDTAKADVLANKPAQIKVVEKWENLLTSIHAGAKPSCYIVTAMKLLNAKGTITSAELVAAMKAEGAAEGTARSQTGQMMVLFSTLGMGLRTGQTLALRQDSVLAAKLTKILTA